MASSRTRLALLASVALGLTVALAPGAAQAEPSAADRQTARTLLIEGRNKLAAGDAKGALVDFNAAHAIMQVPTTGLDLARAQVALGLLVEGRATAHEVTLLPVRPREPEAFAEARAEAADLSTALEARIPSLRLRIQGAPEELIVARVDGEPIPRVALGQPRKLNPGSHEVTVEAGGFVTERREITLKDAEVAPVEVEVVLVPVQASEVPVTKGPLAPQTPAAPREERVPVPTWAWVAGGAGLAGLAASVAFAVDHAAARAKIDRECPGSVCDRREYDVERMQALRSRWNWSLGLSVTLGVAGAAGIGAAVGGVVLRPQMKSERAALVPLVGPGVQGVAWSGVF
ncbi:hypothetical protein WMF45_26440 [Sorangium sp. So ce448]|uniref:hypothetical protein n=1 Tax=Sorangium sp. So ce448 TaxID=3133314 RepID=UPI003F606AF9